MDMPLSEFGIFTMSYLAYKMRRIKVTELNQKITVKGGFTASDGDSGNLHRI